MITIILEILCMLKRISQRNPLICGVLSPPACSPAPFLPPKNKQKTTESKRKQWFFLFSLYLPSSSRSMISRASGACLSIFSGNPK